MTFENLSKEELIKEIDSLKKENALLKKKTSIPSNVIENEKMLFSVLNLLPYSSIIIDFKGNIIACNELAIQFFCNNQNEVVGNPLKNYINKKFYANLTKKIETLRKNEVPLEFEEQIKNKIFHLDIYPIRTDEKKPEQIIFFARDITSVKRLQESESKKTIHLEKLLETAKNMVSCLHAQEVLKIIAREAMNIIEAQGCTIYILQKDGKTLKPTVAVDPSYEKEILKQKINIDNSFTGKAVKAKKCLIFNQTRPKQNGFQIPGTSILKNERLIVAPFIAENKILGALTLNRIGNIFTKEEQNLAETFAAYATIALENAGNYAKLQREIRERKKAENKIVTHQEHLQLINRILRHDLMNGLAVIKSAVRLYKANRKDEYLEEILKNIRKSIDLIRRMKELETIVTSQKRLVSYELSEVLQNIIYNFKTVKIDIRGRCKILADETLISVFNNIIHNSILHGKADEIQISMLKKGKMCEVTIADNGIGIPSEIRNKIFDESYKYGKTGNTGLGLFIVKKAIESYGGKVRAEMNKPRGIKIILTLQRSA